MRFRSRRRRNRLPLVLLVLGTVLGVMAFFETHAVLGLAGRSLAAPTPEARPRFDVAGAATPVSLPTATPEPVPTPTPVIHANDPRLLPRLRGFAPPVRGARLPNFAGQLPNAPRPYRNGVHQGIDFYSNTAGVPVKIGTEVLSARAGRVVRADVDYREHTEAEMNTLLERARRSSQTPPEVLDALRGRQVWIYHGEDVYTRYAHLSAMPPGIRPGVSVERGQVIGFVGNSGSPEAAEGTNDDVHLHFEIWIGEEYFGEGQTLKDMREWLAQMFGL